MAWSQLHIGSPKKRAEPLPKKSQLFRLFSALFRGSWQFWEPALAPGSFSPKNGSGEFFIGFSLAFCLKCNWLMNGSINNQENLAAFATKPFISFGLSTLPAWSLAQYADYVVGYISGFIVKALRKKILCFVNATKISFHT